MATKKKMLQAAAGNAGGAGPDVEDVFSTYLYTGESGTQTITNGIDLDGEGGLVWIKDRLLDRDHTLIDTERGGREYLFLPQTDGENTRASGLTFNVDGFTTSTGDGGLTNFLGRSYASWTFRKAPKFFDVVKISITRDGSNNLTSNNSNATVINGVVYVNHNLDSVPGLWMQKCISATGNWFVRSASFLGSLKLNSNTAKAGSVTHTATSTQVMLDDYGTGSFVLGTHEYIIYLFAAGGDGEFGPNGDQDIIKCDVFTPNTSGEVTVDLGFEPQFLIYKNIESPDDWVMFDNMRGWGSSVQDWQKLAANSAAPEEGAGPIQITSTGFTTGGTGQLTNKDYIYIAIRRGTKVPESATEVFAVDQGDTTSTPAFNSGFVTDFNFYRNVSSASDFFTSSRLTGNKYLATNSTASESNSSSFTWDFMDGFREGTLGTTFYSWMWKRAPGFFDAVAYTGNGTSGRTVSHNLGVAPEMMWVKCRSAGGNINYRWAVYHKDVGNNKSLFLDEDSTGAFGAANWQNTTPTDSVFSLGSGWAVNKSSETYIAYLFATLAGVSKMGSYTGNGSSQTINCGFTSGSRFILIKRTDSTGDWYVWDTERGIVAGNDPHLSLNTTAAEVTSDDSIDPDSSGFIVNQVAATNINVSSAEYIFYALA